MIIREWMNSLHNEYIHVTGDGAYWNYQDPPLTNCAIKVARKVGPKILQAVQKR